MDFSVQRKKAQQLQQQGPSQRTLQREPVKNFVETFASPHLPLLYRSETCHQSSTMPPLDPKRDQNELVVSTQTRCGANSLDAQERCGDVCQHSGDCASGMYCYGVHPNVSRYFVLLSHHCWWHRGSWLDSHIIMALF